MKNLATKLFKFQKEMGIIEKSSINPFYSSNYADINAILKAVKPVLDRCGLVVIQPLDNINGAPAITTILIDPESGESIQHTSMVTIGKDAQAQGGSYTYHRRYSLQSLLGLEAEDDDANSLVSKPKKPSAPKSKMSF